MFLRNKISRPREQHIVRVFSQAYSKTKGLGVAGGSLPIQVVQSLYQGNVVLYIELGCALIVQTFVPGRGSCAVGRISDHIRILRLVLNEASWQSTSRLGWC